MRHLRDQLSSLRDLAESEQRQNVFAHYESFIRVSREISRLQGQVGKLREMVQVPSDVVKTLVADARSHQDDAHEDEDEASATLRRAEERAVASARAVTGGGVDGTLGTLGGRRSADELVGDDGVATGDARRAAKLRDQLEESLSGREVFAALEAIDEGTKLLRSMRDDVEQARGSGGRGKSSRTFEKGDEEAKRRAPEGRPEGCPERRGRERLDRRRERARPVGFPSLGETRANPLFAATRHRTAAATTGDEAATATGDDLNDEPAATARKFGESAGGVQADRVGRPDGHPGRPARDQGAARRRRGLAPTRGGFGDGGAARRRRRTRVGEVGDAAARRDGESARASRWRRARRRSGRCARRSFTMPRVPRVPRVPRSSRSGSATRPRDSCTSSPSGRWVGGRGRRVFRRRARPCWRASATSTRSSPTRRHCVAEGLLETTQTHPGINGAMKRVLDAATEAFIADDGETDGVGSSGGWIDAGERWLETHARGRTSGRCASWASRTEARRLYSHRIWISTLKKNGSREFQFCAF